MFKFVGTIFLAAAATAAAFFVAEPARAATAVLQPHAILLDGADQASSDKVIAVRGGFGGFHGHGGFGGGGMMWRHGGGGWHGGGWHGGGWHGGGWHGWHGGWGHRRWYGPGWGYAGWGAPLVYGGYYGGPCGYGFRWTYRWGCVPIYGY
jgi:hypothetical protein